MYFGSGCSTERGELGALPGGLLAIRARAGGGSGPGVGCTCAPIDQPHLESARPSFEVQMHSFTCLMAESG